MAQKRAEITDALIEGLNADYIKTKNAKAE